MPLKNSYDTIIIGGGLGGLTAANTLARAGRQVLVVEQHTQLGGLATYFRRREHIFDVALHGFPIGMKKSLRKYWGADFAARVAQVRSIRFHNPQYRLESTFDKADFSARLVHDFKLESRTVDAFFDAIAQMNYYDDQGMTTREFFQRFFPGRTDVWRFLMEPIAYANGSTLDEPAISYGIVFGNFMSEGVYTFLGGTDLMLKMMAATLAGNNVDVALGSQAEAILIDGGRVDGVRVNGRNLKCRAVISNGSLPRTVFEWAGTEHFTPEFLAGLRKVRLSTSSCQVYIGIKPGEKLPYIGDLLFTSEYPEFDAAALCDRHVTSRTYSVYYPEIRPGGGDRYTVVASMNARFQDWDGLPPEQYRAEKERLCNEALDNFTQYVPNIRAIADYVCAATPHTFQRYTGHLDGATFGTKFEGLTYSQGLCAQVPGLFHAGSVGIIMSGWLGAANYGVITANAADRYLATGK